MKHKFYNNGLKNNESETFLSRCNHFFNENNREKEHRISIYSKIANEIVAAKKEPPIISKAGQSKKKDVSYDPDTDKSENLVPTSYIRKYRKILFDHIQLKLKSIIESKLITFFWNQTWESGRLWTPNEVTSSFLADRLNHEQQKILKALKSLVDTGFLKRTPCGNKSFRYSLDFECEFVKQIIEIDNQFYGSESKNKIVHNSSFLSPDLGQKDIEEKEDLGQKDLEDSSPIYIYKSLPNNRYLKESKKESPPVQKEQEKSGVKANFQKWEKQNPDTYQKNIEFIKGFIDFYKLDWQCVSFLSKDPDMLNVLHTLKIIHHKLHNGFKPRKSLSAYVSGLIKNKVGREHLNQNKNVEFIQKWEDENHIKLEWTKKYVCFYKGNDRVDIQLKMNNEYVKDVLNSYKAYLQALE